MRLELAVPGLPEAEATVRDIERLREEYQASHRTRVELNGGSHTFEDSGAVG